MSVYVVHQCDWCKVEVRWHVPTSISTANAEIGSQARELPKDWKTHHDDPIFPSHLCPGCDSKRSRSIAEARRKAYDAANPPPDAEERPASSAP